MKVIHVMPWTFLMQLIYQRSSLTTFLGGGLDSFIDGVSSFVLMTCPVRVRPNCPLKSMYHMSGVHFFHDLIMEHWSRNDGRAVTFFGSCTCRWHQMNNSNGIKKHENSNNTCLCVSVCLRVCSCNSQVHQKYHILPWFMRICAVPNPMRKPMQEIDLIPNCDTL